MTNQEIMEILKTDLQVCATQYDTYLDRLIGLAREAIADEGITIRDNQQDGMLVEIYAAYLYRKRKDDTPMPRMLRYMLNNRLFKEKAGGG